MKRSLSSWTCTECDEKFSDSSSYMHHMQENVHAIVCQICNTEFISKKSLKAHKQSRTHSINQQLWEISNCNSASDILDHGFCGKLLLVDYHSMK